MLSSTFNKLRGFLHKKFSERFSLRNNLMMFKKIPTNHALASGAGLWVLESFNPHSPLSVQIDWHLKFLSRKLKDKSPLLIESSNILPCQKICFINFENPKQWIQESESFWKSLNHPSLKIFLPQQISFETLNKNWIPQPLPYSIQWVQQ